MLLQGSFMSLPLMSLPRCFSTAHCSSNCSLMNWYHAGELRKGLMIVHNSNKNLFSIAASLRHIKVSSFGRTVEWSFLQVKACHNGRHKKRVSVFAQFPGLLCWCRSGLFLNLRFNFLPLKLIHEDRIIHGVYKLLVCSYWAVSHCSVLLGGGLTIQNLIVSHCMDVLILVKYCM